MDLLDVLKVLADETRLRILNVLRDTELCVCEIQYALGASQPNISRHLARLHAAGLVTCAKKAQWVSYRLNPLAAERYPFLPLLLTQELAKLPNSQRDLVRLSECRWRGIPCEWQETSSPK